MFSRICFGRHFLGSLIASTLFIGSLVASNAYAQPIEPEPAKWGDVSLDALQRTAHPIDSNATAIIL